MTDQVAAFDRRRGRRGRNKTPQKGVEHTMKTITAILLLALPLQAAELYPSDREPAPFDAIKRMVLRDADRSKNLELRVTYPQQRGKYPVILFSHGATGSKDVYQPLATYWASFGYVVVQPTHLDSYKYGGRIADRTTISRAWKDRVDDVVFILDSLGDIEKRLPDGVTIDGDRIAVAGHSYGAITSQMIAGMEYVLPRGRRIGFADDRPKCFVIISPQGTGKALTEDSYAKMTRPMLMITGDNDGTPYGDGKGAWRREAFDNAPAGKAHLMWIKDAHHAFGGIAGPIRFRGGGDNDPEQVKMVQSMSLAFFDHQLKQTDRARPWFAADTLRDATDGRAWIETRPAD
jgi:dienelactone hydrolase